MRYFPGCEVKSHTREDHRTMVRVMKSSFHTRDFYLFDSSGQVLDKKPPEVVKCLQLPTLCEENETQLREKKIGHSKRVAYQFVDNSNWLF